MSKRTPITRKPEICYACQASSGGKCRKHEDKGRNPDLALWEEADSSPGDANEWESAFLESTRKQIDQGAVLSSKQTVKLEEIRDRLSQESSNGS